LAKSVGGGGDTSRVGKIQFVHSFQDIISIENLLEAWEEFAVGKRSKSDVQEFENDLMDNIIRLHFDLQNQIYRHGDYHAFRISDPKPRKIHKAAVCDRLLHHAVHRLLYLSLIGFLSPIRSPAAWTKARTRL